MKLLLAIIRDRDDVAVSDALSQSNVRVTRIASTGGFLRRGNVTLLIGVEDERVQAVLDMVRSACAEPESGQHRATVFVLRAEQFEQV
ncbi:MAG TPA: cyclic-di-AMP receptor [Anaerolineales bacterium]|nr:cyclic-di-AMP receptor [Anaerolineales bacterium]HRF46770.1 cyclic-di-AMP receptor [Anaerolineales bacterium]